VSPKDLAQGSNIPNGEYTLYLRATDNGNRKSTVNRTFTVDNTAPVMEITKPIPVKQSGSVDRYTQLFAPLITFGETLIEGRAADNFALAAGESVKFRIGQYGSTGPTDNDWAALNQDYIDGFPAGHGVSFNGSYFWNLTFTDVDVFWNDALTASNWVGSAKEGVYWRLPVYFRIEDSAGNLSYYVQYLDLDPEGSVPRTSIDSPVNIAGTGDARYPIVGGALTVQGTSTDDTAIYDVSFRVVDEDTSSPTYGQALAIANTSYELHGAANSLPGQTNAKWYHTKTRISGPSPLSWEFTINTEGELNPTGTGLRKIRVEAFAWDGNPAEAGARNGLDRISDNEGRQFVRFTNSAPVIDAMQVKYNGSSVWEPYTPNMRFRATAAEKFSVKATVLVPDGAAFKTITWQGMEMAGPKTLTNTDGTLTPGTDSSVPYAKVVKTETTRPGFTGYTLTFEDIDPTAIDIRSPVPPTPPPSWGEDRFKDKANTYSITLYIDDKTTPTSYWAQQSLNFQIDNYVPKIELTGAGNTLVGTNQNIQGTFSDYEVASVGNNVYGVKNVRLWFSSMATEDPIPISGANDPYVIIDKAESALDTDGDGYVEYISYLRNEWSVRFNTLQLPYGQIRLWYQVEDMAGNKSPPASKTMQVRNNEPVISRVILYSDFEGNADGTAEAFTYTNEAAAAANPKAGIISDNYNTSNFTVRKKNLSFTVLVNNGNGPLNFRVSYLDSDEITKLLSKVQEGIQNTSGTDFYTLTFNQADFGVIADRTANSAKFLVEVWDSILTGGAFTEADQLKAQVTMGLTVENTDNTAPTSMLYDLNPSFNRTAGATPDASRAAAAAPLGIDENRNMAGLYNLGSAASPVASGHIEPRKNSVIGNEIAAVLLTDASYPFTADTVSGKVILRGCAYDRHRVEKINLSISNVGASWNNGDIPIIAALDVSNKWKLTPVSNAYVYEEYRSAGHYVEWAYVWDSEVIPAVLNLDSVTVSAVSTDAAAHPNTSVAQSANNESYNSVIVDIAPYILSVKRDNTAAEPDKLSTRSTQGWYSAYRGETLTISGYNLKSSGDSTLTINNGADIALAAGQTSHEIKTNAIPAAATSGPIVLKTTGTEISAVNSRIKAIYPWNQEYTPELGSDLWDSSRYIHIWNSTADAANGGLFNNSGGGSDISMTSDGSGNLYGAWAYPGSQSVYNGRNNNSAPNLTINGSDPSYDTDITYSTNTNGGVVGPTVAYNLINTQAGNHANFNDTGGILVWDKNAPANGHAGSAGNAYTLGNQFNQSDPAGSAANTYVDIFKRPRVAVYDNHIYVSYYDQYRYALWFGKTLNGLGNNNASNLVGSNVTADNGRIIIDGSGSYVTDFPSNDVGSWSAIDTLSDGRVAIAYFDASRDTVKLAVATDATNKSFYKADLLDANDKYHDGSGTYVSLKIDSENKAHVAFANTNENTVIYATGVLDSILSKSTAQVTVKNNSSSPRIKGGGPVHAFTAGGTTWELEIPVGSYAANESKTFTATSVDYGAFLVTPGAITLSPAVTNPAYFTVTVEGSSATQGTAPPSYNFTSMAVDTSRMNGVSWVDLSLDSAGNPYITYIYRTGHGDGAKVALRNREAYKKVSVDNQGVANSGWDAFIMPAAHPVLNDRLSIENWTGEWKAAVGYLSNDLFRVAFYSGLPGTAPPTTAP
jgi:hypothetical protein